MQKLWKVKSPYPALSRILARKLGISPVIAQILINRGIHTIEQGRRFLGGELDVVGPILAARTSGGVEWETAGVATTENAAVRRDVES